MTGSQAYLAQTASASPSITPSSQGAIFKIATAALWDGSYARTKHAPRGDGEARKSLSSSGVIPKINTMQSYIANAARAATDSADLFWTRIVMSKGSSIVSENGVASRWTCHTIPERVEDHTRAPCVRDARMDIAVSGFRGPRHE